MGLVPDVRIVPLHAESNALADDIRQAKNVGVSLFNISQSSREALKLGRMINANSGLLFVVAAGNDGRQVAIWNQGRIPAILGDLENVIVVAATMRNGQERWRSNNGQFRTNYGPKFVSIAAPGEGFYGAGDASSYVPAEGTSFATPIVTAAAALLLRQGLSAHEVKARLLYTADYVDGLRGYVSSGGLNVDRALRQPNADVLTSLEGNGPRAIDLDRKQKFEFKTERDEYPVRAKWLKRITRTGDDHFRVIYWSSKDSRLEIVDDIELDPTIELLYRENGQPQSVSLADVVDFVARSDL